MSLAFTDLDGRKRNVVLYGWIDPASIITWFNEVKKRILFDLPQISRIVLYSDNDSLSKKNSGYMYITFENKFKSPYKSIEYGVSNNQKYNTLDYIMAIFFYPNANNSCIILSFDFSLLPKISLQKYLKTTKKYMQYSTEIYFDTSKTDSPIEYFHN